MGGHADRSWGLQVPLRAPFKETSPSASRSQSFQISSWNATFSKVPDQSALLVEGAWMKATGFTGTQGKPLTLCVTPEARKLCCKMKGRVPEIGDDLMATPAAGKAKVAKNPLFSCAPEKAHESQEPGFQ